MRTALALGSLATLPSLAWGIKGADYLTDDFVLANDMARRGVLRSSWDLAVVAPRRPGAAPYFGMIYGAIGDHPAVQASLLAVLNALVVLVLWRALRRVISPDAALVAALVFAVVPNRGSTRMWFAVGSNVLALVCVLVGFVLASRERHPPAVVALVLGVLMYEGVAGLALLAVVWWWSGAPRERWARALTPAGAVVVTAGVLWAVSPKRDVDGPGPFHHAGTILSGVLGHGFWGNEVVGALASMAILVLAAVCAAQLLPSFRRSSGPVPREVVVGAVIVLVASMPFMVGGAPFAVRGIFDRNNLVPDVGVCVILGSVLAAVVRRSRPLGFAATAAVALLLAAGNLQDVRDYRAAVADGQALASRLERDVDPTVGQVVVLPPLPGDTGVDQFILGNDLTAAMELRLGRAWRAVRMPALTDDCEAVIADAARSGEPVFVYQRIDRTLTPAPASGACSGR